MKFVSKYFLQNQFKNFFQNVLKPIVQKEIDERIAAVLAEKEAREKAISDLTEKCRNESETIYSRILSENERATGAEESLQVNIDAEKTERETDVANAKIVASAISLGIATKLEEKLTEEKERAINAENELFDADNAMQAKIDTLNADAKTTGSVREIISHLAPTYTLSDTRNDNQSPMWYIQNTHGLMVKWEFKDMKTMGLGAAGTYCALETIVPWLDISGGTVIQIAYQSSSAWVRNGNAQASAWGAWAKKW